TTLAESARLTGGAERTTWDDVFKGAGTRDRQMRDLVALVTVILLAVHVLEIGGRRLLLFGAASARLRRFRIPRPGLPWRRRQPAPIPESRVATSNPSPAAPPVVPPTPVTSALARAKAKARSRLER
ncbi:MAG: hypothetical protein ABIT71_25060, partial [Vicinamibacteraceae bacterium]